MELSEFELEAKFKNIVDYTNKRLKKYNKENNRSAVCVVENLEIHNVVSDTIIIRNEDKSFSASNELLAKNGNGYLFTEFIKYYKHDM